MTVALLMRYTLSSTNCQPNKKAPLIEINGALSKTICLRKTIPGFVGPALKKQSRGRKEKSSEALLLLYNKNTPAFCHSFAKSGKTVYEIGKINTILSNKKPLPCEVQRFLLFVSMNCAYGKKIVA
jgi:hypothetical protein